MLNTLSFDCDITTLKSFRCRPTPKRLLGGVSRGREGPGLVPAGHRRREEQHRRSRRLLRGRLDTDSATGRRKHL